LLWLDLLLSQRPVSVYGTRLDPDTGVQGAQIAQLLGRIPPGAALFMGDLKASPGTPAERLLRAAGFEDAFESAGRPGAPTMPADNPVQRADWIWIRGLRAHSAYVLDARGSDHRLVAAELELEPFKRP
jgi:endonuclease/exonuclease/phosphatase (EEP) superfamily protein YafD